MAAEKRRKENEKSRAQRRGRGGYMGESKPVATAGPFSTGSVFSADAKVGKAFPRPWAPSKRRSTSKVKRVEGEEPESSKTDHENDVRIKHEDGGFISSEEDENQGPRKNVDSINLISDEEGDAEDGSARLTLPVRLPIRIRRIEHKDRAPPVSAEASRAVNKVEQLDSDGVVTMEDIPTKPVRKGKQKAQDNNREHETQKRWRGVYDDEDEMLVDEEVSDDQSSTSSPKQLHSPKKAKREMARQRVDSPVFQTEEELQERKRQQKQIDIVKAELCAVRPESHGSLQDEKLDQIYIFQFPPKLPDLINPSPEVKDEPESPPTLPTNQPLAGSATATPASSAAQNLVTIKIEDDAPSSRPTTFSFSRSTHLPTLNPGRVGKLKIRNSGRATLDWGGTSLHLNKAIDPSFLQNVIMVRTATQQTTNARSEVGGEAVAFGQVRGKFAVAPDWERMLE
jgi:DNA-directed RNA polymerase III subunit RPC4